MGTPSICPARTEKPVVGASCDVIHFCSMRICTKCGVEKPVDQFRVDRGYVRGGCRECERKARAEHYASDPQKYAAASRKWSRENPEQRNATKRAWYSANKEHHKKTVRLRMYGLSPDQYQVLWDSQNGKCAICGRITSPLCVDHDHRSGRVRGLLCKPCNSYLGIISESVEVLSRAVSYLQR